MYILNFDFKSLNSIFSGLNCSILTCWGCFWSRIPSSFNWYHSRVCRMINKVTGAVWTRLRLNLADTIDLYRFLKWIIWMPEWVSLTSNESSWSGSSRTKLNMVKPRFTNIKKTPTVLPEAEMLQTTSLGLSLGGLNSRRLLQSAVLVKDSLECIQEPRTRKIAGGQFIFHLITFDLVDAFQRYQHSSFPHRVLTVTIKSITFITYHFLNHFELLE